MKLFQSKKKKKLRTDYNIVRVNKYKIVSLINFYSSLN